MPALPLCKMQAIPIIRHIVLSSIVMANRRGGYRTETCFGTLQRQASAFGKKLRSEQH
jgi:hypothetical protein